MTINTNIAEQDYRYAVVQHMCNHKINKINKQ